MLSITICQTISTRPLTLFITHCALVGLHRVELERSKPLGEEERRMPLREKEYQKPIIDKVDMVIPPEEDRTLTVGREAITVT